MLRGGMGAVVVVVVVVVAAVVVVRRSTSSRFASSVPLDAFFMKAAFRCRTAGAAAFGTSSPSSGSNVGRLPVGIYMATSKERDVGDDFNSGRSAFEARASSRASEGPAAKDNATAASAGCQAACLLQTTKHHGHQPYVAFLSPELTDKATHQPRLCGHVATESSSNMSIMRAASSTTNAALKKVATKNPKHREHQLSLHSYPHNQSTTCLESPRKAQTS